MNTPGRRDPARWDACLRTTVLLGGVFALMGTAAAAPWGVPLGGKPVKATVGPTGDIDAYMVDAPEGGRLDVTIRVPKASSLVPTAELIGPSGTIVDATFEVRGRALVLKKHVVAETGRHEIRVAGTDGSVGAYTVSAKVKGSTAISLRGVELGAAEERSFSFVAAGGAKLTFAFTGRNAAPEFLRVEGPNGLPVAVTPDRVRRSASRKLRSRPIRLPATYPYGEWRVVVRGPSVALNGMKVNIKARGGGLKAVRGKLLDPEPLVRSVTPTEAGVGATVRVEGVGFEATAKKPLRVFVGGVEITSPIPVSNAAVDVVVPDGIDGLADVAILTPAGHAVHLPEALLVVPPPRPVSFEPTSAPAAGGTVLEIRGSDFRPGVAVTIAGTAFPDLTEFVSSTQLRFTTPAFASGAQSLGVRDATGQEGSLPTTITFVAAPFVQSIRPSLVPLLDGEVTRLDGGNFTPTQTVTLDGDTPATPTFVDDRALDVELPSLALGAHDIEVRDELGQVHSTPDGITVFTFSAGPAFDDDDTAPPADIALSDFDGDDDLDVFLVLAGEDTLAAESLVRVLRNDGDAYVDVTDSVMPAITTDDWRAHTLAFGDVAGDIGTPPPDGWPDLVIGSLDDTVLPSTRSRIRILANRAKPGGGRHFVDRTDVIMSATSTYDDWAAEDLWIGDLDGDGGVADIVATHDAVETGVGPLTPYYVYYLSGTRVFSLADSGGGYGRFAHQSRRFPTVIGTQVSTPGFPLCINGSCADDYTPFRGTSLAVADLDDDGRKDVTVTTPGMLTVSGSMVASTQVARNEVINFQDVMTDQSRDVNPGIAVLAGEISLAGDVSGTGDPDLVIIRRAAVDGGLAIDIAENRGFGTTWRRKTQDLLPAVDGDEALQADDAALVDIDGDGDLDLVLVTSEPPDDGTTTTGLGLRLLRNRGAVGFSRRLETLLPDVDDEDWSGAQVAVGDFFGDGGLAIVIARANSAGTGTEIRTVLRTTSE